MSAWHTSTISAERDRTTQGGREGGFFRGPVRVDPRGAYVLAVLVVSLVAGVAIVRFPAQYVFGAVGAALIAGIIVAKPFLGLVLYTSTFMLRPGELYPPLDALHIERFIGVLCLIGMYLEQHRMARRLAIDGTRQTRLLLLFIVTVLISVPMAYWRLAALNGVIDFLKLLAWYLLVVHLLNTRRRLRTYLALFLVLVSYIAFDSLRGYFSGSFHYRMGIERAVGQTDAGGDPNHLAATMAATIPLLLLLVFYRGLRWARLFSAAGVVLLAVTMGLTGSRSGLLGFLGGLLFLWRGSRHRVLAGLAGIMLIGAGLVLLPQQYQDRYASISRSELDGSSKGRIELWKKGLRMAIDRPLTGVGIRCFPTANAMDYSPKSDPDFMVSHSLYVQLPAELGLIGTVAFFAFLIEVFRLNRRKSMELHAVGGDWKLEATVLQGLAAGLFVLLITGVFGDNLMRHTWYVYAALGAAIARLRTAESSPAEQGARPAGG